MAADGLVPAQAGHTLPPMADLVARALLKKDVVESLRHLTTDEARPPTPNRDLCRLLAPLVGWTSKTAANREFRRVIDELVLSGVVTHVGVYPETEHSKKGAALLGSVATLEGHRVRLALAALGLAIDNSQLAARIKESLQTPVSDRASLRTVLRALADLSVHAVLLTDPNTEAATQIAILVLRNAAPANQRRDKITTLLLRLHSGSPKVRIAALREITQDAPAERAIPVRAEPRPPDPRAMTTVSVHGLQLTLPPGAAQLWQRLPRMTAATANKPPGRRVTPESGLHRPQMFRTTNSNTL